MKFKKPGPPVKPRKIKNKTPRLHDIKIPRKTHCRFCGEDDNGTCYWHHCEITYLKLKYGKGVGKKIDDSLSVWAHHSCGAEMSKKPIVEDFEDRKIIEWEYKWLLGIIESHLV